MIPKTSKKPKRPENSHLKENVASTGRTIVLLEQQSLRSLVNKLPDDRRLFVLVALRPAYRAPENDFISFRPKSPRYACTKCMQPTSQELCRMRTTQWLGSIWTEDDESSLLISDVQRVPGRAQLAHSQIVFFRVFRVFRCSCNFVLQTSFSAIAPQLV